MVAKNVRKKPTGEWETCTWGRKRLESTGELSKGLTRWKLKWSRVKCFEWQGKVEGHQT